MQFFFLFFFTRKRKHKAKETDEFILPRTGDLRNQVEECSTEYIFQCINHLKTNNVSRTSKTPNSENQSKQYPDLKTNQSSVKAPTAVNRRGIRPRKGPNKHRIHGCLRKGMERKIPTSFQPPE